MRFLAYEHIKLGIFKTPNIDFLIDLLVHCLKFKAEVGRAFSLNKAVAVVIDLCLYFESDTWPCFLGLLGESGEVIIANFVLVPPKQPYE